MQSADVYNALCPSRNILSAISDKWSILILKLLLANTYRFGALKRQIGGISAKMLTQTLLKLERMGLVTRVVYPVLPLKVEYFLTPLGKELAVIVEMLTSWTEKNLSTIMACQQDVKD